MSRWAQSLGSEFFSLTAWRSAITRHLRPPASSMSCQSARAVRTISVQASLETETANSRSFVWNTYRRATSIATLPPPSGHGSPREYSQARRRAFRDRPALGEVSDFGVKSRKSLDGFFVVLMYGRLSFQEAAFHAGNSGLSRPRCDSILACLWAFTQAQEIPAHQCKH